MAFAAMSNRTTNLKTEQLDMDSLFDFSGSTTQPSPATASSSKVEATPKSATHDWNAISPFDQENRHFAGPSHDYNQYKQQVGLPTGSMANMPQPGMFDGYGSGIDMNFDSGFGWSSGIDMDSDVNMDFNNPQSAMPPMFFPPPTSNNNDSFIDPSSIQEEPTSNVGRLWPGMHSQQAQQAAMQKAAQVQAVQQRQMKLQAQHAQYRQAAGGAESQGSSQSQPSQGHAKRPSHVNEPHVEESISRLLNQMRQNSNAGAEDDEDSPNMLPQLARLKKDEEEMDEDERLLASEEGKKLSSKERRQLRNKVSARAFRSRRKEYIGQLEGEVAMKAQENNTLRNQNAQLMQENDRYRGLIETLLRHPSFHPFIQDISQDPSVLGIPQQQPQQQRPSANPAQQPAQPAQPQQQPPQQDSKPDYMNFDASQLSIPQQQPQQTEQVGLAMIPEADFSKMNINGFNTMNFNNFQQVNAFAVLDVPGPDPVDLLIESPASLPASTASSTCASDMTVLLAKLDGAAYRLRCTA